MKHNVIDPVAKSASSVSMRPQRPEKMRPIVEDAVTGRRNMALEQQAAFIPPGHEEERVLRSQGDQGRQ